MSFRAALIILSSAGGLVTGVLATLMFIELIRTSFILEQTIGLKLPTILTLFVISILFSYTNAKHVKKTRLNNWLILTVILLSGVLSILFIGYQHWGFELIILLGLPLTYTLLLVNLLVNSYKTTSQELQERLSKKTSIAIISTVIILSTILSISAYTPQEHQIFPPTTYEQPTPHPPTEEQPITLSTDQTRVRAGEPAKINVNIYNPTTQEITVRPYINCTHIQVTNDEQTPTKTIQPANQANYTHTFNTVVNTSKGTYLCNVQATEQNKENSSEYYYQEAIKPTPIAILVI